MHIKVSGDYEDQFDDVPEATLAFQVQDVSLVLLMCSVIPASWELTVFVFLFSCFVPLCFFIVRPYVGRSVCHNFL